MAAAPQNNYGQASQAKLQTGMKDDLDDLIDEFAAENKAGAAAQQTDQFMPMEPIKQATSMQYSSG